MILEQVGGVPALFHFTKKNTSFAVKIGTSRFVLVMFVANFRELRYEVLLPKERSIKHVFFPYASVRYYVQQLFALI